ncbi:lysine decarboxylase [Alkalibacillus flavidus]|uniref:Lysine decarboxylase n=1 Tax=Alkalibacillus flavidus TaxID=546021 RepID=A0ABV2KWP4_9BACI
MDQTQKPLVDALQRHIESSPYSFHVPGHKNGQLLPEAFASFQSLWAYDVTELPGLDDLHEPSEAIAEAESLAADFYDVDRTYFLVNGSTAGNLAMILAACEAGDRVLVQRNSHKSIMHGLQLAGVKPVFIAPDYDEQTQRYSRISPQTVEQAFVHEPSIKAVVLTYPDYFGATYNLPDVVSIAHRYGAAVLVDEAHGAHFKISDHFPPSAVDCGADVVVQSAHKTLPALTMGSWLHLQSSRVNEASLRFYLQMFQSSSPSYLIMFSLDLARHTVANMTKANLDRTLKHIADFNRTINQWTDFDVMTVRQGVDDPLKTVITSQDANLYDVLQWLHHHGIDVELVDQHQLLFIHGLMMRDDEMFKRIQVVKDCLNTIPFESKHGKIDIKLTMNEPLIDLPYSYRELSQVSTERVSWQDAVGRVAAQSFTPYPPGIPIILDGEPITSEAVTTIQQAMSAGIHIQTTAEKIEHGVEVYSIK